MVKLNNLDLIVLMLSGNCFIGTAMYRTRLVQSVISEASSFGLVLDYCINLILVCRHLLDGFALSSFDFNYRQHSETISETQMDLVNFQCYRFLQRGPQLGRNFELLRKQEMCNRAMLYSLVSSSWLERVSWAFASICNKPYQLNPYKCLFKRIFNIQKIK